MEFIIKSLKTEFEITGVANVHFFEFDKNYVTEIDKHPFYELIFVSNGELKVISESFTGSLEKNHMIIHTPNEKHSLSSGNSSATVIIIGFTCKGINDCLTNTPLILSDIHIKTLAETVKEARNVFAPPHNVPVYNMKKNKNQIYGSEQMLKVSLERFFINLIRENSKTYFKEVQSNNFNVKEIVSYIDDKYKEKITLNELSFIFGTNRTTLCKEFKLATGKSVLNYVLEKKINDAKAMISNTNDTFTEISNMLNFESIHYFTRLFKKKTGYSPKEYRKLNKKDG